MISIKFLLVISLLYKTGLLWELGTWSHRFFNNFSLLLLRLTVENLGTRKDASYGVPRAKVAILRLSREEHKYSLAFEKSFRLHCRESPIEAYLKERRRRTRRARNIRFRSFFRNLFDFEDSNASSTTPWTTKKMLTENLRQIPYKFK